MRNGLAFLGGTFDPIHAGHLHVMRSLYEILPVDRVYCVPVYAPVHKNAPLNSPEQRVQLIEQAIAAHPELGLETYELTQRRPVYTIETLEGLRHQHPNTPLMWIVGSDQWNRLESWHEPQKLAQWAHFVVVPRGSPIDIAVGARLGFERVDDAQELGRSLCGKFYVADVPYLPMSSSDIRDTSHRQ